MKPLPFSYNFNNSTTVHQQTTQFIKNNQQIDEQLFEMSWAFHSIGNAIPQTIVNWWSGHYFPFSESFAEFEISFLLCSQGFYKQSMMSLRSVLETGLLSVYYNINDEGHKTVQGWLQSEVGNQNNTPVFGKIWQILMSHSNILKFQNSFDIRAELLSLGFLHDYVHSKGFTYSNQVGLLKSNTQSFEVTAFFSWLETAHKIVKVILILHILKYPIAIIEYDFSKKFGIDLPSIGGLNSEQIARIKSILGKEIIELLVNISLEDKDLINFIKKLEGMPDITQIEIEKQIKSINRIINKRYT